MMHFDFFDLILGLEDVFCSQSGRNFIFLRKAGVVNLSVCG